MEDIFCESAYGGENRWENWRAPQIEESEREEEEAPRKTPEKSSVEIMESLSQYEKMMKLWADIIEKGPSYDPATLATMRQQINDLLLALGVVDADGKCDLKRLVDFALLAARYKETPIKRTDYPNRKEFVRGVMAAVAENRDLFDGLEGRGGKELGDYLYGLGMVLDTQLVYENIFENDPIVIGHDGSIQNGRHRQAVLETFAKCNYVRQRPWVKSVRE